MSIWYCAVSMATVTVRLKPLGGCQSSLLTLPVKSFISPPSAMSRVVVGNSNKDSCKTKLQNPLTLKHSYTTHSQICRKAILYTKQSKAKQLFSPWSWLQRMHASNSCNPFACSPNEIKPAYPQHRRSSMLMHSFTAAHAMMVKTVPSSLTSMTSHPRTYARPNFSAG